jgi:hypothetical protein
MWVAEALKPVVEDFLQLPELTVLTRMMTVQFPSPVGGRMGGKV